MATDFAAALDAEIDELERQLEASPAYMKLRELRHVRTLYTAPAVNPLPRIRARPVPEAAPSSGRSPSPERQAILDCAKDLLEGSVTPTRTSDLYDMLALMVNIPGASPKNNLSAMLSNSREFKSHGRAGWTLATETPEAPDDLLTREASEASMSSPASPAGEPSSVRPVDPVPGGGT